MDFYASPVAVAPMVDWTDRHCRHFHRTISKSAELYTEMIVDKAVIHGDHERLLGGSRDRVVLQIGGSEPRELAEATKIAADYGYQHINLNCGCPSDRVISGTFGAVLMLDPPKVARALEAMQRVTDVRISIKCRLGVDDQNENETLPQFLKHVHDTGVRHVILHARKAILKGLTPDENRKIPPLNYELAQAMLMEFPDIKFSLNGGIKTFAEARSALGLGFAQVMIGRAAYHNPYEILSEVDQDFANIAGIPSREDILEEMIDYAEVHIEKGGKLHHVSRHMIGLFQGQAGARNWRHRLSSEAVQEGAKASLLREIRGLSQENAPS